MFSCLAIKSHSRSKIAVPFFQYNSTIITTTVITTIADSVRTVLAGLGIDTQKSKEIIDIR